MVTKGYRKGVYVRVTLGTADRTGVPAQHSLPDLKPSKLKDRGHSDTAGFNLFQITAPTYTPPLGQGGHHTRSCRRDCLGHPV
jgi:hypothetical protein